MYAWLRATALVAGVVVLGMATTAVVHAQPGATASVRADFGELDQYGEWYKLPKAGWVWSPYADDNWRPFMYGRWEWTHDGWMWESDEPFGWIVCHYGNWYYDDAYGWLWVPGYVWSPARVQWVMTDDDVCWAPMPPSWCALPDLFAPAALRYWVVVPYQHFTADNAVEFRLTVPRPGPVRRVLRHVAPDVVFLRNRVNRPIAVVRVEKRTEVVGPRRFVRPIFGPRPARGPLPPVPIGPRFKRLHPGERRVETVPTQPGGPPRREFVQDQRTPVHVHMENERERPPESVREVRGGPPATVREGEVPGRLGRPIPVHVSEDGRGPGPMHRGPVGDERRVEQARPRDPGGPGRSEEGTVRNQAGPSDGNGRSRARVSGQDSAEGRGFGPGRRR